MLGSQDTAGDGGKGRKKRGAAVKRKAEEPEESKPSDKKRTKAAKKEGMSVWVCAGA